MGVQHTTGWGLHDLPVPSLLLHLCALLSNPCHCASGNAPAAGSHQPSRGRAAPAGRHASRPRPPCGAPISRTRASRRHPCCASLCAGGAAHPQRPCCRLGGGAAARRCRWSWPAHQQCLPLAPHALGSGGRAGACRGLPRAAGICLAGRGALQRCCCPQQALHPGCSCTAGTPHPRLPLFMSRPLPCAGV